MDRYNNGGVSPVLTETTDPTNGLLFGVTEFLDLVSATPQSVVFGRSEDAFNRGNHYALGRQDWVDLGRPVTIKLVVTNGEED
jgi:hypothetical protein